MADRWMRFTATNSQTHFTEAVYCTLYSVPHWKTGTLKNVNVCLFLNKSWGCCLTWKRIQKIPSISAMERALNCFYLRTSLREEKPGAEI